jgi:hypothetical protein
MTQTPDWSGRTDAPHPPAGPPPEAPPYPPPYPYGYPPGPYPGSYPPPPMPYGDYAPVVLRNGLGVAALVVGVLGIVASFTVVGGVILGVVAVVLGLVGRARVTRGEASNGGVALTGIVLGVIAIVAGLAFIQIWVTVFNEVGAGDYFDCLQQAGQDPDKVQQCSDQFRQSVENRLNVTATPTP